MGNTPAAKKKTGDDGDLGRAEAQERADVETEQGFVGTKVDPRPNSDHSLESGPDGVTPAQSRADLEAAAAKGDEGEAS